MAQRWQEAVILARERKKGPLKASILSQHALKTDDAIGGMYRSESSCTSLLELWPVPRASALVAASLNGPDGERSGHGQQALGT